VSNVLPANIAVAAMMLSGTWGLALQCYLLILGL
jgi:hypothetical protein